MSAVCPRHIRVRVRDLEILNVHVRFHKMPLLVFMSKLDGLKVDVPLSQQF